MIALLRTTISALPVVVFKQSCRLLNGQSLGKNCKVVMGVRVRLGIGHISFFTQKILQTGFSDPEQGDTCAWPVLSFPWASLSPRHPLLLHVPYCAVSLCLLYCNTVSTVKFSVSFQTNTFKLEFVETETAPILCS